MNSKVIHIYRYGAILSSLKNSLCPFFIKCSTSLPIPYSVANIDVFPVLVLPFLECNINGIIYHTAF